MLHPIKAQERRVLTLPLARRHAIYTEGSGGTFNYFHLVQVNNSTISTSHQFFSFSVNAIMLRPWQKNGSSTPVVPPTPPSGGFFLKIGTACLTYKSDERLSNVLLGNCDQGSKWTTETLYDSYGNIETTGALKNVYVSTKYGYARHSPPSGNCGQDVTIVIGEETDSVYTKFTKSTDGTILLKANDCPGMCIGAGSATDALNAILVPCNSSLANKWTQTFEL
eukprot:m.175453 g.175453  ORF g.175453 m.175453 type:complete len:223 (-) comp15426_c1_seq1:70-738(-)